MNMAGETIRHRDSLRCLRALAVVLSVAALGCVRTPGRARSYVRDRGLDLVDCFHVHWTRMLTIGSRPFVLSWKGVWR